MFNAGCFMKPSSIKAVWGGLLYPFLLNVYMHDFDQFVENLNDEYFNIAILCDNNSSNDLTVKKYGSRPRYKFSNKMLKIYDELVICHKKYQKTLSNCVASKGRPFENV